MCCRGRLAWCDGHCAVPPVELSLQFIPGVCEVWLMCCRGRLAWCDGQGAVPPGGVVASRTATARLHAAT